MLTKERFKEIVHDIYVDLYDNATPKASFDELFENATFEDGIRDIGNENFTIDHDLMFNILHEHGDRNMLDEEDFKKVEIEVLLGYSPKSVKDGKIIYG